MLRRGQPRVFSAGVNDHSFTLAGVPGFEPRITEPESVVLPLHYTPMGSCAECTGSNPQPCSHGNSVPMSTLAIRLHSIYPDLHILVQDKETLYSVPESNRCYYRERVASLPLDERSMREA